MTMRGPHKILLQLQSRWHVLLKFEQNEIKLQGISQTDVHKSAKNIMACLYSQLSMKLVAPPFLLRRHFFLPKRPVGLHQASLNGERTPKVGKKTAPRRKHHSPSMDQNGPCAPTIASLHCELEPTHTVKLHLILKFHSCTVNGNS